MVSPSFGFMPNTREISYFVTRMTEVRGDSVILSEVVKKSESPFSNCRSPTEPLPYSQNI